MYVTTMFIAYLIVCMPTEYVSWFSSTGINILLIPTILIPVKLIPNIKSAKDIFTLVCN